MNTAVARQPIEHEQDTGILLACPLTSDLRPPPSDLRPPTPDLRPPTPDLRPVPACRGRGRFRIILTFRRRDASESPMVGKPA